MQRFGLDTAVFTFIVHFQVLNMKTYILVTHEQHATPQAEVSPGATAATVLDRKCIIQARRCVALRIAGVNMVGCSVAGHAASEDDS
jgi:hypothetical protein